MKFESIGTALYVLVVICLAIAGGIVIALFKVWPYPIFDDAYKAFESQYHQWQIGDDPLRTDLWRWARNNEHGVIVNAPQAQQGYTLYTSGDGAYARLINMKGQLLHQWHLPYSKVWNKTSPVTNPTPDDMVYMRRARVLPNGDLIAIYISANDTPWGYGIVKMDAKSHIIWRYLAQVHHDFNIAKNGDIVTLSHAFSSQPIKGAGFVPKPYLEDYLVTLGPDGKKLQQLSITQMLADSPYITALRHDEPYYAKFDPLHVNTVNWLDAQEAKALGIGKAGDVLIMFRQINLLALVDPQAQRIVWATRGPWLQPHDPHVLPNGDILMFDNLGNMLKDNRSRVLEINPHNDAIKWSYSGSNLDSVIRSTVERQPNGDTLITESDGGRMLEITHDKKIVWEFVNPIRGGENDQFIPVVSGGYRYAPSFFDPAFRKTLKPSGPAKPQ